MFGTYVSIDELNTVDNKPSRLLNASPTLKSRTERRFFNEKPFTFQSKLARIRSIRGVRGPLENVVHVDKLQDYSREIYMFTQ